MIHCQCQVPQEVLQGPRPCSDWSNWIWWQHQQNIWQMVLILCCISNLLHRLDSLAKHTALSALKHHIGGKLNWMWADFFTLCVTCFIILLESISVGHFWLHLSLIVSGTPQVSEKNRLSQPVCAGSVLPCFYLNNISLSCCLLSEQRADLSQN